MREAMHTRYDTHTHTHTCARTHIHTGWRASPQARNLSPLFEGEGWQDFGGGLGGGGDGGEELDLEGRDALVLNDYDAGGWGEHEEEGEMDGLDGLEGMGQVAGGDGAAASESVASSDIEFA